MISALEHLTDLNASPSNLQPGRLLGTRAKNAMPMRLGNNVVPPRLPRYPQFLNAPLPQLKYWEGLMRGDNHALVKKDKSQYYELKILTEVIGVCDCGEPYKGIEIINE